MAEEGFAFEKKIDGARGEAVEYWRRAYPLHRVAFTAL
jgi:hypothetical protein